MYEERADAARRNAEVLRLETDVRRLQERVEGLAATQQEVRRSLDALSRELAGERDRTARRLDTVEGGLKASDASLAAARQEIVDNLSKRMGEIMRSQTPPSRPQQGYEHTVQAGETLSAIAAAYRVKVDAIVKANKLKDAAATIRIGQKLFIPE
jgi:seryl-tRNA synthetase